MQKASKPFDSKMSKRLRQFRKERGFDSLNADPSLPESAEPLLVEEVPAVEEAEEPSRYLAMYHYKQQLAEEAALAAAAEADGSPLADWRPLGPFNIPHGQTYGRGIGSRPSVSGRVSAIAVDPDDDDHILIGAAGGGVWETRDKGSTWEPRTDKMPSLAIGAIAFTPGNPQVVYAGTGEGDAHSDLGTGLLRSGDGGKTWNQHVDAPFVKKGFYDLIVDPLDDQHLLAGVTDSERFYFWGGLLESFDGGSNWQHRRVTTLHTPSSPVRFPTITWSLSMHPVVAGDPDSTKEVFAACGDGLHRSIDGGRNWSKVSLPGAEQFELSGIIGKNEWWIRLEVCHAPSDGNIVYVFGTDLAGVQRLWRRNLFDGDFEPINPPSTLRTSQASYDWFASVAPDDPDTLYLGSIEVWKGMPSQTGTWYWTTISNRKGIGDSIHPDQHAIAFSPSNSAEIYIGNDGGVYHSPDGGESWISLNAGLCITEIEYLAQHPDFEAYLLAGTQDNGTLRFEGGEVWQHVRDGDGGDCSVNANQPNIGFHTFYGMGMERSLTGGGIGSWQFVGPNPPAEHSSLFYPPLETQGSLVVQAGSTAFISTDNSETWTAKELPSGTYVEGASALAINFPYIYIGTDNGHMLRIDYHDLLTGVWRAPRLLTSPDPAGGYISDILVDSPDPANPPNPDRLWVTYSNYESGHNVYRSDDGGFTWQEIGIPAPTILSANAIEMDPLAPSTVWVATDSGVWESINEGGSWHELGQKLPNSMIKDLVFHRKSRLLRAGTHSRGVWEINVDQPEVAEVELYVRDNAVDTGSLSPSPVGAVNPFTPEREVLLNWDQCVDIKVDAPPYDSASLSEINFEKFEDDQGFFAVGVLHDQLPRNKRVRVYLQVHNRGPEPAVDVEVKLFYAGTVAGVPDLPASFWNGFPNNTLPADSPWQAVANAKTIAAIKPNRSEVVGFQWDVPATLADRTGLLAVITAPDDAISTTELNVENLVRSEKKCGLRNVRVVTPS